LRLQRERDEQLIADLRARGEPVPFALRETDLVRNFERAFARYRPTPWDGRAVLFRAAEVDFFFAEGGPRYGWEKDIRGGVDIVKVPGGHHTLVVGANAEVLARALSEAIERVQVEVATRRAS
jgi:thioesterase domain-containing protein